MMKMAQSVITGLTKALSWLRDSFGGLPTVVWAVSYWPIIAGLVVGLPFAFVPAIFDLTAWAYLVTAPIGFAVGLVGYGAAYLYLEE